MRELPDGSAFASAPASATVVDDGGRNQEARRRQPRSGKRRGRCLQKKLLLSAKL
jgi:hypothetical protein